MSGICGQTVTVQLITTIEDEIKEARLAAPQPRRRDALTLILASLRAAEKDLQCPLSDDEELQVLQRERKKRVEAYAAFEAAGREEQADKEDYELEVLEAFMPEPLSEDDLDEIVDDVIAEVEQPRCATSAVSWPMSCPCVSGSARRLGRQSDRPRKARRADRQACLHGPISRGGPSPEGVDRPAGCEPLGAVGHGDLEQVHVHPWSTVIRVPTTIGDLFFKANADSLRHEAALVPLLAERRPDCIHR